VGRSSMKCLICSHLRSGIWLGGEESWVCLGGVGEEGNAHKSLRAANWGMNWLRLLVSEVGWFSRARTSESVSRLSHVLKLGYFFSQLRYLFLNGRGSQRSWYSHKIRSRFSHFEIHLVTRIAI